MYRGSMKSAAGHREGQVSLWFHRPPWSVVEMEIIGVQKELAHKARVAHEPVPSRV